MQFWLLLWDADNALPERGFAAWVEMHDPFASAMWSLARHDLTPQWQA